jgi:hypothetical protein
MADRYLWIGEKHGRGGFKRKEFGGRYHVGQPVAQGQPWTVAQVEKELRPGADDLQNELATAVIQAISQPPGDKSLDKAHRGRPASWAAVSIIIIGFIVGGVAMIVGSAWWFFWVGAGIVVVGGIFALSVGIFNDWC